jgi:hypothetical protein
MLRADCEAFNARNGMQNNKNRGEGESRLISRREIETRKRKSNTIGACLGAAAAIESLAFLSRPGVGARRKLFREIRARQNNNSAELDTS